MPLLPASADPLVLPGVDDTAHHQRAYLRLHHGAEILRGQQCPAAAVENEDGVLLTGNGLHTVQHARNEVVVPLIAVVNVAVMMVIRGAQAQHQTVSPGKTLRQLTNLQHKHLPEMQTVTGLAYPPVFMPVVDDYYKGMATTIMLQNRLLPGQPSAEEICAKLADYYRDEHFVSVVPFGENDSKLYANKLAGTNRLEIVVCGHEEQTTVTAVFDNLGKGASGAAVQNMNIMLGLPEETGLE